MRTKDRLAELKNVCEGGAGAVYHDTVEMCDTHTHNDVVQEDIRDMFHEVETMRCWIHDMNGNTQLMRRLYADPTFHNNKNLQEQLDSVITQSNAIGLKVCGALRQFEGRVSAGRAGRGGDVRARLSRLQYAATRRLYEDALAHHDACLQLIKERQYQLLHEQIRLTNLTISDEECQNLLETNNISLFVDNVRAETAEARLALRDVEARHDHLLKIEDSIREVRDLFVQMSHLVAQQQDLVDTVEYYATQASDLVEYGGQELLKGTVSQRKARKKKMGLIICMVSGFLIVLFVLIVT